MSTKLTLEKSLFQSMKSDLSNIAPGLAEVGFDSLLEDGVFKEVPIIGTIQAVINTTSRFREHLFAKRIWRFLVELDKTSILDRLKFLEEITETSSQDQLSETLLLQLERLDDMGKPEILARFFSCYVKNEISVSDFRQLAAALERITIDSIQHLQDFYLNPDLQTQIGQNYGALFSSAGLVSIEFFPSTWDGDSSGKFTKNKLGLLFIQKYQANT